MPYLGKSPSQGVRTRFQFTPNAGTTSISGADANGLTLSFTDGNYVDVYLNGVMLKAGVDYNTNTANTIAGLSATVASDVVDIVVYDTFSVFGGTLEGNVKVNNGTFNVTGAVDFDSTLNVDGAVTTDGLTVDGNAQINGDITVFDGTGDPFIKLQTNEQQFVLRIDNDASDIFQIRDTTNAANRLAISTGGDISFYEDTGSTAKLFWDASAESLGIGTTSPQRTLHVHDDSTYIQITNDTTGTASGDGFRMGYFTGQTIFTMNQQENDDFVFSTNNTERMRIDSSGNVGIGTTSPSAGLHIDNPNDSQITAILDTDNSAVKIVFRNNTETGNNVQIGADGSNLVALTNASEAMRIDSNGRVGIGESSPDTLLHISDSVSPTIRITNTDPTASVAQTLSEIQFEGSDSSTNADGIRAKITALYGGVGGFTSLQFFTAGENTETLSRILDLHSNRATINEDGANIDFRVESSGSENMLFVDAGNDRVGIGTNSPTFNLTVQRNDNETYSTTGFPNGTGHFFKKNNSGTANQYSSIRLQVTNDNGSSNAQACITAIKTSASTHATTLAFQTRQSGGSVAEAFRVDDSQRVIVGKTSNSSSTAGTTLYSNGKIEGVRDGDVVHSFNRLSSNGTILSFQKDGTTVGSINSRASLVTTIILDPRSSGFGITGTGNAFFPTDETGNSTDGTKDVGTSGNRFDDIHATNGTIQTSDKNEKNTIVDSDLGLDFIKRLSPKSYKFNNKTRTHYGLIAQDVETVLSDISKSSTDFAGFIKDDISEDKDGSHYRYGLRYTELIAPIIKALQEANAKIETLEIEVAKLKGE